MIPTVKEPIAELMAFAVSSAVQKARTVGRVLLPADDQAADEQIEALAEDLIADLDYLEAAASWTFRESMPGRDDQTLVGLLNAIYVRGQEIERALVLWINLVDVVINNIEKRYGESAPGDLKCAEVKRVVRYLLQHSDIDYQIGDIPGALVEVIVDIVVEQIIDALVEVLNEFQMWQRVPEQPTEISAALTLLTRWLTTPFRLLLNGISKLINWIWFELLRPRIPPLSPAVRSALKAVEDAGLLKRQTNTSVLHDVADLALWIRNNREQIIGLISFIFRVVNDIEQYLELSGAQKQQLAETVILDVLQRKGFIAKGGLLYELVANMIHSSIKVAVSLFNRHGRFQSRTLGQM